MLKECVTNKYYARFDNYSYHSCRETNFHAMVNLKLRQSQCSMKYRSSAPGQSAYLKGMLKIIIRHGSALVPIIAAKKRR